MWCVTTDLARYMHWIEQEYSEEPAYLGIELPSRVSHLTLVRRVCGAERPARL